MGFEPDAFTLGDPPLIYDLTGDIWEPLFRASCTFGPDIFSRVMANFIRNPNVNSSWLFRADVLLEQPAKSFSDKPAESNTPEVRLVQFREFDMQTVLVRRLIPRNTQRDNPMEQTCIMYHGRGPEGSARSMVVYKPHVSSSADMPFYHPNIQGLAFLHEWDEEQEQGTVSIHYHFYPEVERSPKLVRTGLHLLTTLHKHGKGSKEGYTKRVHHDTIIPQIPVQTTYARLKQKYARRVIATWAEVTDPSKHVFEDLGIAAFLIELWAEVYKGMPFPGFVDIGCGNGLLVYILRQEGYQGWGFDARERKSWANYNSVEETDSGQECEPLDGPALRQHVLFPSIIQKRAETQADGDVDRVAGEGEGLIHDGIFAKGTFIISNHADELTPWTPILAMISECPFIMIPCCSHDLTGSRFRAPAPRKQGKSESAYSSLVEWVSQIAADCGWQVEREMLRIPSTRNTGLVGRRREQSETVGLSADEVIEKYGGAAGYAENVMKLAKSSAPRGH